MPATPVPPVPPSGRIVLFGATGYTGDLVARALVREGARPVLAGRDAGPTRPAGGLSWATSSALGLTWATRPR